MTIRRSLALVAPLLVSAVFASPAFAEPPELELTLGSPPDGTVTWDGEIAAGANTGYDSASGEPCGDTPDDQCHTVLLHVNVPAGYWDVNNGGVEVHLGDYFPNPASDFDLYIYETDATGSTRGPLVDSSADLPGLEETAQIPKADGHYLLQVVYFAVTASRYSGEAKFFTGPPKPPLPDVDEPPGLQDVLASDPSLGFRSHSEPHIAQSPTDPNFLVAASKMYNRDPDSLKEYEFKIGSYVSFDGGNSWTDLGQTAICSPEQSPPDSWPNNNCYPEEDPNKGGVGPEDEDDPDEPADASDPRGSGDVAEEYITSDPWVQFDDEGNAYLMVLDSPFFDHGNGWGMSFHRWVSPSPQDISEGNTWSRRIVINSYADQITQPNFLDDKNTFAVNNAGPDNNNDTGPIVACWGQNVDPLIKQQTVCERSTDGGKSWPGRPLPISPPNQQLVIGVNVIADNENPQRFYAVWLHYTPELAGEPAEYWFARSNDGGQTWGPPSEVTQVVGIPTNFPTGEFRNLSIPIMAAGPKEGELYLTYAEYRPAPFPGDLDGMQADIMFMSSDDGGASWSEPKVVNGDGGNADQFQPYIAVTPSNQVNVVYFDRRHDPGNYHIDTYLSRSNDRGKTFTEIRLSHDMWDPSINPPISGAGHFIGDYQGLVADDCVAIPFVNDTHLANDPARDPEFDSGLPRSSYQEVFSWRVANTQALGGEPVEGRQCERRAEPPGCRGRRATILGDSGDNTLRGTRRRDVVYAGGGDDVVKGLAGNDKLCLGLGSDRVQGGGAKDVIHGGGGSDTANGGPGPDRVVGGRRADTVSGGGGNDLVIGGQGPDRVRGAEGKDRCRGGPGDDMLADSCEKQK